MARRTGGGGIHYGYPRRLAATLELRTVDSDGTADNGKDSRSSA